LDRLRRPGTEPETHIRFRAAKAVRRYFFFLGTFLPALRACERPIAIACFLLFTFFPLPLLSVPFFRSRMVLPTFFDAALEYFLAAMTSPHENHCIYNDLSAVQFRNL
jgi:hypothetical protein